MGRRLLALTFGATAVAACGLFPSVDTLGGDAASSGSCSGTAGPVMVNAGSFCIDSTEVTNDQYAQFLGSNPTNASLPSTCQWKSSFTQDTTPPSGQGNYPAATVDWCEAYAYCAWAGKRLCGRVGGGALTPSLEATLSDEWYVACSHAGASTYPYGNTFDPTACDGPEHDAGVLPSSSLPKCAGGYAGVLSMVGNVDEWVDECTPTGGDAGPKADSCFRHGGSFLDPAGPAATCSLARPGKRSSTDVDIGFRCCSDLH